MAQKFSNNAQSVLPASLASGATSFSVKSGEGGRFPVLGAGDFFMVTVVDASGTVEIMKCTARSGDTLTVERAQEGTTAADFPAGSLVQHRMTAGGFTDEISRIESKADEALNTAYLRRGNLPSDSVHDLNDYGVDATGIWHQPTSAYASTGQNYPVSAAGTLEVMPWRLDGAGPRVTQRYTTLSTPRSYIRSQNASGAWSSWEQQDTINLRNAALADYAPLANLQWLAKPIGEPFPLWDHIPGCPIPPTNDPRFRFIKLTAADGYNSGVLIAESVSGTAPLVSATGKINMTASPINGATVRLINTEARFLRAGVSGTVQNDALQNITASLDLRYGVVGPGGATGAFDQATIGNTTASSYPNNLAQQRVTFDASRVARTANETRGKNIQATYYMRIM